MWVGLPTIQNRLQRILDIRNIQFVFIQECVIHAIDGLVPPQRAFLRGVTFLQSCSVPLIVRFQSWEPVQVHKSILCPGIDQIVTGPLQYATG